MVHRLRESRLHCGRDVEAAGMLIDAFTDSVRVGFIAAALSRRTPPDSIGSPTP